MAKEEKQEAPSSQSGKLRDFEKDLDKVIQNMVARAHTELDALQVEYQQEFAKIADKNNAVITESEKQIHDTMERFRAEKKAIDLRSIR